MCAMTQILWNSSGARFVPQEVVRLRHALSECVHRSCCCTLSLHRHHSKPAGFIPHPNTYWAQHSLSSCVVLGLLGSWLFVSTCSWSSLPCARQHHASTVLLGKQCTPTVSGVSSRRWVGDAFRCLSVCWRPRAPTVPDSGASLFGRNDECGVCLGDSWPALRPGAGACERPRRTHALGGDSGVELS